MMTKELSDRLNAMRKANPIRKPRVGASERILLRQLHDLILEKYGTLERFCRVFHYRFRLVDTFLSRSKFFNRTMYDIVYDQVLNSPIDVNRDGELLDKVIKKYCGGHKKFCADLFIRESTLEKFITNPKSSGFRSVAYKAYSHALHKIEKIDEYISKEAPAKFMIQEQVQRRNIDKLKRETRKKRKHDFKLDLLKQLKNSRYQ